MSRLYSESELAEIARPFESHALDALRAGDLQRLRALLNDMKNGPAGLDALSGHALARKAAKLRRDFGEAFALDALARIGAELMRTWSRQFQQGDERGAIAAYDRALELSPNYMEGYAYRGLARASLGQLEAAIADYDRALTLTPPGSGAMIQAWRDEAAAALVARSTKE